MTSAKVRIPISWRPVVVTEFSLCNARVKSVGTGCVQGGHAGELVSASTGGMVE
jgi:hypothetical protein